MQLQAPPEEAPEPIDDSRLERFAESILERMQWFFDAALAAQGKLEGKFDEVRRSLDPKVIERAFEVALERTMPPALQKVLQPVPEPTQSQSSQGPVSVPGPGLATALQRALHSAEPSPLQKALQPAMDNAGCPSPKTLLNLPLQLPPGSRRGSACSNWMPDGRHAHKPATPEASRRPQEPLEILDNSPVVQRDSSGPPNSFVFYPSTSHELGLVASSGLWTPNVSSPSEGGGSRPQLFFGDGEERRSSHHRRNSTNSGNIPQSDQQDAEGAVRNHQAQGSRPAHQASPSWSSESSEQRKIDYYEGYEGRPSWGGSSVLSHSHAVETVGMDFVQRFQNERSNSRVRPSFRPFGGRETRGSSSSKSRRNSSATSSAAGDAQRQSPPPEEVVTPVNNDPKPAASCSGFSGRARCFSRLPSALVRTRSQSRRLQRRLNTKRNLYHREELERETFGFRFVLALCTFLVLVNAFWVGLRSHYVMRSQLIRHGVQVQWNWAGLPQYTFTEPSNSTGLEEVTFSTPYHFMDLVDGQGWGHPLLDGVFTLLFLGEIATRLWLYRWEFFLGERWRWNLFDVVLICVTVVHWFFNVFLIDSMGMELTRLPRVTFLRILRLPRVAIDLSHLDCIHSLQLMTASILHSLTFSWVAFSVVICIIYLFSVIFVQGIIDRLENAKVGSIRSEDLAEIAQKFGSVQITLLSLFQAISGGIDWIELMGPLNFAPWRYTILLFVYVFVVTFGVLNIVTSMFVECVCQVTKENYKERIRTELLAQKRWMEQLRTIFAEADEDESGGLSWNEFSSLVNVPMMRAYFTTLELNIEEAKEIFEYLDVRGEGEVNMQDFVRGCVCLRGEAKSVDIAVLRSQWQKTSRQLLDDMRKVQRQMDCFNHNRDSQPGSMASGTPRGQLVRQDCFYQPL